MKPLKLLGLLIILLAVAGINTACDDAVYFNPFANQQTPNFNPGGDDGGSINQLSCTANVNLFVDFANNSADYKIDEIFVFHSMVNSLTLGSSDCPNFIPLPQSNFWFSTGYEPSWGFGIMFFDHPAFLFWGTRDVLSPTSISFDISVGPHTLGDCTISMDIVDGMLQPGASENYEMNAVMTFNLSHPSDVELCVDALNFFAPPVDPPTATFTNATSVPTMFQ